MCKTHFIAMGSSYGRQGEIITWAERIEASNGGIFIDWINFINFINLRIQCFTNFCLCL